MESQFVSGKHKHEHKIRMELNWIELNEQKKETKRKEKKKEELQLDEHSISIVFVGIRNWRERNVFNSIGFSYDVSISLSGDWLIFHFKLMHSFVRMFFTLKCFFFFHISHHSDFFRWNSHTKIRLFCFKYLCFFFCSPAYSVITDGWLIQHSEWPISIEQFVLLLCVMRVMCWGAVCCV